MALANSDGSSQTAAGAGKIATYDVESPPGHAIHRIVDTLFGDDDEYRGTAEQYGTAFALLAGSIDIPVRLVVGYQIAPEMVANGGASQLATVRQSDLDVWVEALFVETGWVTFTAGPEEDANPDGQPTQGGGASSLSLIHISEPTRPY